jgi:hypothetical protein
MLVMLVTDNTLEPSAVCTRLLTVHTAQQCAGSYPVSSSLLLLPGVHSLQSLRLIGVHVHLVQ